MRQNQRTAEGAASRAAGAGFAGFVGRNATPAFRYAVMLLDDPVAAQDAVHDALMATWTAASQWPPSALDAAFGRRFVGACRAALKTAGGGPEAAATEPEAASDASSTSAGTGEAQPAEVAGLARALAALDTDDRLLLAERFGMPDHIEPVAITLRGRGSLERRVPHALDALASRLAGTSGSGAGRDPGSGTRDSGSARTSGLLADGALGARLRSLYAERDPGEAPTQLRWRLQRSLTESERAAAEQAEIAAATDWTFPVKTVLVILVFVLAIALASVVRLNGSEAASSAGASPPATFSIAAVTVLSSGIDGPSVHVAPGPDGFFASFEASSQWHVAQQQCRPDVVGNVAPGGEAHWLGEQTAHFSSVVGEPASGALLASGTGVYCQAGVYGSLDGGRTWTSLALPAGEPAAPEWIGLDPSRPGHVLQAAGGRLYVSSGQHRGWTSSPLQGTPVTVDERGRIVAWSPGRLLESWDEGTTWNDLGPGPNARPAEGVGMTDGAYLASPDGLWWSSYGAAPLSIHGGSAFSVARAGAGVIALGADAAGRPWLATIGASGVADVPLPAGIASLHVTGGQVAVGTDGVLVALSGAKSAIVFASFAP